MLVSGPFLCPFLLPISVPMIAAHPIARANYRKMPTFKDRGGRPGGGRLRFRLKNQMLALCRGGVLSSGQHCLDMAGPVVLFSAT